MRARLGLGCLLLSTVGLAASCSGESGAPAGRGHGGTSGASGAAGTAGNSSAGEGGIGAQGGTAGTSAGGEGGDSAGAAGASGAGSGGGGRTGAVGDACDDDSDCVFMRCASGECATPRTGPDPTGAVDVVLDERGGTATLVTDERVTLELEVPRGALTGELRFRFTPETPTDSSFLDVTSSIPGVAFRKSVTLRVTLPTGVTFDAEHWLSMNGGSEFYLVDWADEGADVLELETSFLGQPAAALETLVPVAAAANVLETRNWEDYVIRVMALPLDQALMALSQLYRDLLRSGRGENAAQIRHVVEALVIHAQGNNDPRLDRFIQEQTMRVCTAYTDSLTAFEAATFECDEALRAPAERLASLGSTLDAMGSSCGSDWKDAVSTKIGELIAFIDDPGNRFAMLSCQCNHRAESEQPAGCSRVIMSPLPLAVSAAPPNPEDEWDVILDMIARAPEAFDRLHILDAHAEVNALDAELAEPLVDWAHRLAFDECSASGDMSWLGLLGTVVADPTELQSDAELCASTLAVTVRDAQSAVLDTASIPLPSAPGAMVGAVEVDAARGATVELRGPVGTLVCRSDAETQESLLDDGIRLEVLDRNLNPIPLATRQANLSRQMLNGTDGFDLDVDTTLTALGKGPTDPVDFIARLVRTSPGCRGQYPTEAKLFDLHVRERLPFEVVPFGGPTHLGMYCATVNERDWRAPGDYTFPQTFTASCGSSTLLMPNPNTVALDVALTSGAETSGALRITINHPGTVAVAAFTPSVSTYTQVGCLSAVGPCGIFQPMLADSVRFVCATNDNSPYNCKAEEVLEGGRLPTTASMHTNGGSGVMYFTSDGGAYDMPNAPAMGRMFTITYTPDP